MVDENDSSLILEVYDLHYDRESNSFIQAQSSSKVSASLKALILIKGGNVSIPKKLPKPSSFVRNLEESDLTFLEKPQNAVYLGKVRSGSKIIDVDVYLDGKISFPYHILIPAITGRGKSNLLKVLIWSILDHCGMGMLILDPHDEYYGRHELGLKDHPRAKENLLYYSPLPPKGGHYLKINLEAIHPNHLDGIIDLSDEQRDAIKAYYIQFSKTWLSGILTGEKVDGVNTSVLQSLQRKFDSILSMFVTPNGERTCRSSIFVEKEGTATINDIVEALVLGKVVIIDTIRLTDEAELLLGSVVSNIIFENYLCSKAEGTLDSKPPVTIVLEEAPRALGHQELEAKGNNIFSLIAREGRKFKVGLMASTQMTSIIPRSILANINTKLILGNEMAQERKAIIDTAAQDLSVDDRNIASLDVGEAIVTSLFTKFPIPIKVPKFEDYVKNGTRWVVESN